MTQSHLLILNPIAGKGKALKLLPMIEHRLRETGLAFRTVLTESRGHAEKLASEAQGYRTLIAAGGDGTCNEVINGMMATGGPMPSLAILPIGRGNDLAYGVGIPATLADAIVLAASDTSYSLDLGRITGGFFPEGRYFGNGIGIGFDTIVGLRAAKKQHLHGALSYLSGAIETMIDYPKAPPVRISFNGSQVETATQQISILNGRRMGGMFHMAPFSQRQDGLLDLCMVTRPMTRRDMIRLIVHYTKGSQHLSPIIRTEQAPVFRVEAPQAGLVCHADGETVCTDGSELLIECVPSALRVHYRPELPAPLAQARGAGVAGRDKTTGEPV